MGSISTASPPGAPSDSIGNPKILNRRSTLVRKREDDDEPIPSSPGKKARVTFDSDLEVHILEDVQNAVEFVQAEVRQAFEKRAWGDYSAYEQLKHVFNPEDGPSYVSPEQLRRNTSGLLHNVAFLNKESTDLVQAVMNSNWLAMPDDYISLFVRLLANIFSGHGTFVADGLRMLVQNLSSTPQSNHEIPSLPRVQRSTVYSRVHQTLQYILQLIPSAARTLSSVLFSAFPHQTDSCRSHLVYIRNLLLIVDYAPEITSNILNLITERLVKIDVQVQIDLEDLTDEEGETLIDNLPRLKTRSYDDEANDLYEDDSESDSESDEELDEEIQRTKYTVENVEKMDAILDVMFIHYDRVFSAGSSHKQDSIVEALLCQFKTILLPTHRSRHTQFLLFHFLQRSPSYIDAFVGACADIAFDHKHSALLRQAAAAYLASFLARGNHVPSEIVRDLFDYIGSELVNLRRGSERGCRGPDLRRYSAYYSLVQALLYIFCFRWRDLKYDFGGNEDDEDASISYGQHHQWRPGVKESLSANVFSKLNPLKVCSPAIVTEFARVANHLGVVYVYHLLETNKRIRLSHSAGAAQSMSMYGETRRETALSVSTDESQFHLDEYFPFDPYHLPRSKRWIEHDYREWTGIPGLDDQPTDSNTEEEEDGAASEIEEGNETDRTGRSI